MVHAQDLTLGEYRRFHSGRIAAYPRKVPGIQRELTLQSVMLGSPKPPSTSDVYLSVQASPFGGNESGSRRAAAAMHSERAQSQRSSCRQGTWNK
eukprot:1986162-Rhodomonas_salina.1